MPLHEISARGALGALIGEVVVPTGGQASVTFSTIPQNFKDLLMTYLAEMESAASKAVNVSVNGDTTDANYRRHFSVFNNSAANNFQASDRQSINLPGSSDVRPGVGHLWMPSYTGTTLKKTWVVTGGYAQQSYLTTTNWNTAGGTAAVTQFVLAATDSTDFAEGSVFRLWGLG